MNYHDVLAMVGASAAHPGGASFTEEWLKEIHLSSDAQVLDIGCGTGRTLSVIKARFDCSVTGVDLRPQMLDKARKRFAYKEQTARFVLGKAESLAFDENTFDLVLTESVNVFVNVEQALREYYRVLRPGGVYVDVEMVLTAPASDEFIKSARGLYDAVNIPDTKKWKTLYAQAGFTDTRVLATKPVRPEQGMAPPEELDLSTPGAYQNRHVLDVLRRNAEWLEKHQTSLGYAAFLTHKGDD